MKRRQEVSTIAMMARKDTRRGSLTRRRPEQKAKWSEARQGVTEWDQLPLLGSKPPHLTPNIPGGISEGLRTGHRPGTDPLPVGQCLDPSQTGPHTHHASADLTPGSGVDSTHWSLLHSPAGGDEFARLILKAYKVVTTTESSVDDERRLSRRASP